MKFVSWNVNGIRACIKRGFTDFVAECDPDILCIQESKAHKEQVDLNLEGYNDFWNSAVKKVNSGTVIFSKHEPIKVSLGMNLPDHDQEGRVITAEYDDFFLVNVYTPNSKRGLLRLDYRTQEWDVAFLEYLKKLEKKKPVIFCGDLNVAHKEIDIARPQANRRNAGFTDEERERFSRIIDSGFIDTFREFTQEGGHYSWWSYMGRAREKNIGWRIDYWCISQALRPQLKSASILPEIQGSDHCPVVMEFK